jgi:4-carboxymuconolactone decarboxylase
MSLIDALPAAEAPPELRALLDQLPDLPHFRVLAHAQTAFGPRAAYGKTLMLELELPDREQELVILRTAWRARCEYIAVQHRSAAAAAGLAPSEIVSAQTEEAAGLTGNQRALLRFVDGMVVNFGAQEGEVREVAERFGPRQLIEVGLVVERYLGLAILLNSLRVSPAAAVKLRASRDS